MTRRLKAIAWAMVAVLAATALVPVTPPASAATKVVTDKKATVTVTPNDEIKAGWVKVTFSKSHIATNRPVQLQVMKAGIWTNEGQLAAMTVKGVAIWTIDPSDTAYYRAVADAYLTKGKVVTRAAKSRVVTDKAATIAISPVAEAGTGSIKADFSSAYSVKNRPVQLQIEKSDGAGSAYWKNVGKSVKMSSKGVVIFKTSPDLTLNYRAVAAAYKSRLKAVTPKATASWSLERDYGFGTDSPGNGDWTTWGPGDYTARKCAANYPMNVTMKDGVAQLRLTRTTSPTTLAKAEAAGCGFEKSRDTYANSMVYTNGSFTVREGIVAARVKFPNNTVMHGGIWLSPANGSPEIDIIESYGYAGRKSRYSKTTSGIHQAMSYADHQALPDVKGWEKTYKDGLSQTLVNLRYRPASWYKQHHIVSVEFTTSRMIFRIDGKKIGDIYRQTPENDYFLVMSLITTDWELRQNRMKNSQLPATMTVDWVRVWVEA